MRHTMTSGVSSSYIEVEHVFLVTQELEASSTLRIYTTRLFRGGTNIVLVFVYRLYLMTSISFQYESYTAKGLSANIYVLF
jgi:hypothetical protein